MGNERISYCLRFIQSKIEYKIIISFRMLSDNLLVANYHINYRRRVEVWRMHKHIFEVKVH